MKVQIAAIFALIAVVAAEKTLIPKEIERFVERAKPANAAQTPAKKLSHQPFVVPKEDGEVANELSGFDDNDGTPFSVASEAPEVESGLIQRDDESDKKSEDSQSYDDHSSSVSYTDGGSFYTNSKDSFKPASSSTGPGLDDTDVVSSVSDDSYVVTNDTDSYNRSDSKFSETRSSWDHTDTFDTTRSSFSSSQSGDRSHSGRFHSDDEEFDSVNESTNYYSNDSSRSYSESNSGYE